MTAIIRTVNTKTRTRKKTRTRARTRTKTGRRTRARTGTGQGSVQGTVVPGIARGIGNETRARTGIHEINGTEIVQGIAIVTKVTRARREREIGGAMEGVEGMVMVMIKKVVLDPR